MSKKITVSTILSFVVSGIVALVGLLLFIAGMFYISAVVAGIYTAIGNLLVYVLGGLGMIALATVTLVFALMKKFKSPEQLVMFILAQIAVFVCVLFLSALVSTINFIILGLPTLVAMPIVVMVFAVGSIVVLALAVFLKTLKPMHKMILTMVGLGLSILTSFIFIAVTLANIVAILASVFAPLAMGAAVAYFILKFIEDTKGSKSAVANDAEAPAEAQPEMEEEAPDPVEVASVE